MGLIDTAGSYAAAVAALGILCLLPLFLSQRRDLVRLREWMNAAPEHPGQDVAASEAILDRAEAQLESVEGPAPAPAPAPTPAAGMSAAARVTSERPALERITMERAALQPHPRWRRFISTATKPRVLAIVAIVVLLVGVAAIFASGRLLGGNEGGGRPASVGAVNPADVNVAVLNGTSVPGLGAKVGDDVTVNGFNLGTVSNSARHYDQTVVMYSPGSQRAAEKVAHDLGVNPVQPMDAGTRRLVGDASVVVIAGDDRAK